ncbi:hypothetical protein [Amycolatopsis keratiniphila]|uniref:hypothetical protein n=1 Tax=Amycolatopsis keratiniphila TaxID=129921 RepID=UPI0012FAEA46|nr:hypothetical protein [Amycolatopsis keratiniphila]
MTGDRDFLWLTLVLDVQPPARKDRYISDIFGATGGGIAGSQGIRQVKLFNLPPH